MTLIARRVSRPRLGAASGELVAVPVLHVQCGLWQLGFDPGRFDGLWGPVTQSALERWYAWWRSRQTEPGPAPEYRHPPVNRSGDMQIPEQWAEIVAASERGPCRLEPRGAHRAPPVEEPAPLAPPPIVVGPGGEPEPERPRGMTTVSTAKTPWVALGLLALGVGALAYISRKRLEDRQVFFMPPPK